MASLSKYGPEFARYCLTTNHEDGTVEKLHVAVMANRHLLHKKGVVRPTGDRETKNWVSQGRIPPGISVQQFCEKLVADGYEME